MNTTLERRLAELAADHLHGATWLTKEAGALLQAALASGMRGAELRSFCLQVAAARPMMASVFRLAAVTLEALEERGKAAAADRCRQWLEAMDRASAESVDRARLFLGDRPRRLITLSYSSLVAEVIEGRGIDTLVCSESRPMGEGSALAQRLAEAGIPVRLTLDAALPSCVEPSSTLLLGADGIGSFGLVHKVGTYPLLLAARRCGAEVVIVTPTMKFWPREKRPPVEPPRPPRELLADAAKRPFRVINRYFDRSELFEGVHVVTERGVWHLEEILAYMATIRVPAPLLES